MHWKRTWASVVVVLLVALAAGQAQQALDDYLDVYIAQVKPEKRADFDAIAKKIAAANRQNKGDTWLAMETVYGSGDRVSFVSTRHSYGDVETALGSFMQAMEKAYGKPATDKIFQDFNQCLVSQRSEIRRRRWDLSSNAPADSAAYAKMLANTRWLRTMAVHVRAGQLANFEALLKDLKTAREKASPPQTVFVSQAVAGQEGTVFYLTSLQSSLAGFDAIPPMQQLLGDWGYEKLLKASAETIEGSETVINRFLPDLSNTPDQVASLAPDFWIPKPEEPVVAKGKPIKKSVVNAKESTKVEEKH